MNWSLTMLQRNKQLSLLVLVLFLGTGILRAQVRLAAWSSNYVALSSYLGVQTADRFNTFQFMISGQSTHKPNWTFTVRLMEPILPVSGGSNVSGQPFPADKISLIWTGDNNSPNFFLDGIGANKNPIRLQSAGEVKLIDRGKQALSTHGGHSANYQLYAALKIDQGKYLDGFVSPNPYTHLRYRVSLLFTVYDEQGISMGSVPLDYDLQIRPRLTDGHLVDVEPDFSIRFLPEASQVRMQFLRAQDYKEGVRVQLNNAIQVNSNTDYEIRVKSMDPQFVSANGLTLPLSILTIKLLPGQGVEPVGSYPIISLSSMEQNLGNGRSQDKNIQRHYHLNYQAKLDSDQLSHIRTGNYEVSILYLLMPK